MKPTQDCVALVSMPWAPVGEPSLGLSILKSSLHASKINSRVFHLAPRLLHWLTIETYEMIAGSWGINEFIFTGLIDSQFDSEQQDALLAFAEKHLTTRQYPHPRYKTMRDIYELVLNLRTNIIPEFVAECVDRILNYSPKLIGFTCMFDQTLASVAVAKKLKLESSEIRIALGGYALEGDPGANIAQSFPWVDNIVIGDGEEAIVELARESFAGSFHRTSLRNGKLRVAKKVDISKNPIPEYTDWFCDIADLAKERSVQIKPRALPVESSRGCWWGQYKHCVFCGIDEETLKYRFKAPQETLRMLETLREKHGDYVFRFSDYILPKTYYTDLLPDLAAMPRKFRLHCEIKANHPPERVRLMAEAGFVEIQPGIESFSTGVLKRMDKGVRGIDNVSLLKAGYINRIIVDYNFLYGLPGDKTEEYEEMLVMIPRIYHLMPPVARTHTVITRFAPLQMNPERFGLNRHRHHRCYDVLFSHEFVAGSGFDYDKYAYYFERNFEYSAALSLLYSQVVLQIEHWKNLHRQRFVELSYARNADQSLRIIDSRFEEPQEYTLPRIPSNIYDVLQDAPIKTETARKRLSMLSDAKFDSGLDNLEDRRLIWRDGDLLLGLAVPQEVTERHRSNQWHSYWNSIYV